MFLPGCEVYQRVEIEEWKPAGSARVPTSDSARPPEFRLKVLEAGGGAQIKAGSLVHASIDGRIIPSPDVIPGTYVRPIPDVWFWIGVPDLYVGDEGQDPAPALPLRPRLGSDELRAAFVTLRSGSRVSVVVDPWDPTVVPRLPTHGVLLDYTRETYMQDGTDNDNVRFVKGVEYELTVREVCDGRLLQRKGVLRQWGYVPRLWAGGARYPFARRGVLRWVAIDAQCPGMKRVRLEKGPAYDSHQGTLDGTWPLSYDKAARRPRFWTRD